MGYTLTFSAPPALQGFAAYYGGQQAAQRQTDDTQARIDAQNDAQLNNMLAATAGQFAQSGLAGYYYNQAQQAAPGTYAADGMGPPAPGDPAAYQRNMMLAQYALGGPQAASGYLANQEQFRNRMIAQNDAQSFQGEQRQLDRTFTTNEREARQEYRTDERIAGQDFYVNEQIPAQVAGRLGTTPAGVYDTGVQSVIAQGGDPATMSREQIMGIGMQTVQQQNQVRDLTNRQVFSGIQQQQGQIAQNTKPVYSPQQKQRVVQLQNAAANLQSDPKYFNSATGMPTPLGLSARQRIQAELNSIQPRMEYQEPPPTLAQIAGWVPQGEGPPDPALGRVVTASPVYAQRVLPSGDYETLWMQEGKLQRRVDKVEKAQSFDWPEGKGFGETWIQNGGEYTRNWRGEVERLGDAPSSGGAPSMKMGEAEKQWSDDYDRAPSTKMQSDDGKIIEVKPTPEERRQYADRKAIERQQRFGGVQKDPRTVLRARAQVNEITEHFKRGDINANPEPMAILKRPDVPRNLRASLAASMVTAGMLDESQVPGEIAGEYLELAESQDAAKNQGVSQPYEREFRKKSDGPNGPLYIGLYDPATGKVTNERLKQ